MYPIYDAFIGILVNGEMLSLSSAKFASPLGLNVIGTKIKRSFPTVVVRIYNLEINDHDAVKKDIQDIVKSHNKVLTGLTLIAGNVYNSLVFAEWLKSIGCDVVVGGPEISRQALLSGSALPMVDGVVTGCGDQIITDIVGDGLKQRIYFAPEEFDFQSSSVDYNLLYHLEDYGGISILWAGDCHLCNSRCYFCSRQKRGFGWRHPGKVWEELRVPYQMGIRKLYNTADTVAVNVERLRKLVKTKPPELANMKMKCFINATQVNNESAKLLKKLNAWAAVGIESLSRIATVGKGQTTAEDNQRAMKILAKHQVPMILTFVMGLPGETRQSLKADAQQILQIVRQYGQSIYWITVSPLLITLGSKAFYDCLKTFETLPKKHACEYYNPLLLTEQYFQKFCSVKLDEVYTTIANLKSKIAKIAPQIIFDSKGLDPQRWK